MRTENYATRAMKDYGIALLSATVCLVPMLTSSCSMNRTILDEGNSVSVKGELKQPEATAEHQELTICLVKPHDGDLELVSVTRPAGNKDDLKDAIDELLRGPTDEEARSGIASEIPKGTVLLGIERTDDSIVLNLSQRFAIEAGETSMDTRMNQLKQTIAHLTEGKKVYLNIEGERLTTAAGEGLEIKQPIN